MTDSFIRSHEANGACPACGSQEVARKDRVWDHEYGVDWAPEYAQCKQCGSCYQTPMPSLEELARAYPSDYHSMARSGILVEVRYYLRLRRLRAWLESDSARGGSARGA